MRVAVRFLLSAGVALAVAGAPGGASASHCNAINFYSGYRVTIPSWSSYGFSYDATSWVGCTLEQYGQHTNADYILPGSSEGQVFIATTVQPMNGTVDAEGRVIGSYLRYDGLTTPITLTRGVNANGNPNNVWHSQTVPYDIASSYEEGVRATAVICFTVDDCIQRTYRTIGTPE